MKRFKYLLGALILAFAAMIIAQPATVQAAEEPGQTIIFVQVPDGWENPGIWAWGSAGGGLWDPVGWPGVPMMADPANPGWYFQWLPNDMTGGLVNAAGGLQIDDFTLTGEPIWVTVNGPDGDFTVTTEPQTSGDLPAQMQTIVAQIPDGWENPRVWAWGGGDHPQMVDWPGEAYMQRAHDSDWFYFHLPANMTGGLVNADMDGEVVQTTDFQLNGVQMVLNITASDDFTANARFESGAVADEVTFEQTILFVQVPDGWEQPAVWTWGSADGDLWGGALSVGWPGVPMRADPANPGWYFQWLPNDMTGG